MKPQICEQEYCQRCDYQLKCDFYRDYVRPARMRLTRLRQETEALLQKLDADNLLNSFGGRI